MATDRNRLLLVFMIVGIVCVAGLAAYKLSYWRGLPLWIGAGVLAAYVAWLFAERQVSLSEPDKGETKRDLGTCEVYALGRALTVLLALALPTVVVPLPVMVAGVALFLFGVLFRLWAIRTLGQFYSHRVRLVGDHKVVSTGPYRKVRHPAYTGMLTAHLGFVLVFPNIGAALALGALFIPAVVRRILVEERSLFELDGYPEFAAGRKRLVPFVW